MKSVEHPLRGACPLCGKEELYIRDEFLSVPYLGDIMLTVVTCRGCGFRHSDVLITSQKEPTRYTYHIKDEYDMMVRVVRSTSGTVRIPEIETTIEPGITSEAYITNVEGVLLRVERVLSMLERDAESEVVRGRVVEILKKLQSIREGELPATLIIDDPLGNSAIIPPEERREQLQVRSLTEEEVKGLKYGMLLLERDEVEFQGE
ncbi:MAG: hypothetical protein DRN55_09250 [Thermoplasmata archaeon]|nr:MAG: hypothetical protein DRN55_09250 [Thermoplasmata archaeon]